MCGYACTQCGACGKKPALPIRGKCGACGALYELGATRCPECGKTFLARPKAAKAGQSTQVR